MLRRLLILALITTFPIVASGWSIEGHQIAAMIAADRLTPKAAAEVHRLLQATELRKDIGEDLAMSDAAVAGWADEVRRQRDWTQGYHFINIPFDADKYDAGRDDPGNKHIVANIEQFAKVLADKTKPDAVRAEALLFLIHLVGDIHQPLHCIQRGNDRGGNRVRVMIPNKAPNRRTDERVSDLHEVWDRWLVVEYKGADGIAAYADKLASTITATDVKQWESSPAEQWANESHKLAVELAYPGAAAEGTTRLTQEYFDKNRDAVELQLRRGGVRLATVLNEALQ